MAVNVYSKTSKDASANECCWFSLSSPVLPTCSVINQGMWIIQFLWFSYNIQSVSILAFSLFLRLSERAEGWTLLTEFNIWQQIRDTTEYQYFLVCSCKRKDKNKIKPYKIKQKPENNSKASYSLEKNTYKSN